MAGLVKKLFRFILIVCLLFVYFCAVPPPQKTYAAASGDYRSHQTGDWNNVNTWERFNGTSWVTPAPSTPVSTDGVIEIQSGHTVTVTANVTVDQVLVDSGGEIDVNSGVTWTLNAGTGDDLTINSTGNGGGAGVVLNGTIPTAVTQTTIGSGSMTVSSTGSFTTTSNASSTFTINSGGTLTVNSGGATFNHQGTFTANTGSTLTINGAISLGRTGSATTFNGTVNASANITLASISDLEIGGTTTMTAGTLTVARGNGGTLGNINSGGSLILQGSSVFAITSVGTATYTVASGGTLEMDPSALVNGAGRLIVASGANLKIGSANGIDSATGAGSTGNVQTTSSTADSYDTAANYTYDGVAAQNTGSGLPATVNNLTISNSGGAVTLGGAGTNNSIAISSTLQIDSGSILTPPAAAVISGAGGTLTGSGTAQVTRTAATADFNSQYTINTKTLTSLTVEYTNSGQTINNTTYGSSGNGGLKISAAITASTTANVGGVLTTTAAFAPSAGTITMNNGSSIVTSGSAPTFQSITIASSATVTANSSFTIAGTLTNSSSGVLTSNSGTITCSGCTISNSGTTLTFNNLTSTGTSTAGSSNSFTVSGNVTISSGTFTGTSNTLFVGGNWSNAGTFTANSGTVTFNTGTTASIGGGPTTFYDLTITHTSAKEVDFSTTGTHIIHVTHTFTVTGHTGAEIKLFSSSGGTKWHFHPTGTASVDYANVKDGGCESGSITISPTNSTNSLNNDSCWSFGTLSTDIVDSGGSSVSSPSVALGTKAFSLVYQTSSGTLGVSSEKIRVDNSTATAPWTLSIAASGGTTTLWSAGTPKYDYNDPAASAGDGADSDNYGGQLSVNPSVGTITPKVGCDNTGLSLGSSSAFSETGTPVSSITLTTASGSAGTNCYWDITGVSLSQSIPAEQTAQSYSVDMTISVIAN